MNRKLIAVIVLVALAVLLAAPAFADTASDVKAWFESRMSAKKALVDEAVKDGRITPAQGEAWKTHFDEMYKFHEQNGFTCPIGGPGRGRGAGMGFGPGNGPGRGMMGGWGSWQAPAQQ